MTNTPLSEREQELIRLVATGASNKEISQALHISVNTVKVHLRNIFTKLEVTSRTEAAMWAVQNGLVETSTTDNRSDEQGDGFDKDVERSSWFDFLPGKYRPVLYIGVALIFVVIGFGVSQLFLPTRNTPQPGEILVSEDFEETRWKRLADMPTARAGLAAAVYDNQIYAIAGEGNAGVLDANERYDPGSDSWEVLAPKPIAVVDVHAGVVGGQIYVPGGRLANGQVTDVLEIFDPRTGIWSRGAPVPSQVSAYALATFEGKIYLFGGWDGSQYLDSVFIYDPALDDWSEGTPMPTERGFAGAAEVEGIIYVIGGIDDNKFLSVNEAYSTILGQNGNPPWSTQPDMPGSEQGISVVSVSDLIYTIGDNKSENVQSNLMEYLPQEKQWRYISTPNEINFGTYAGLVYDDLHIYIFGGMHNHEVTSRNYSYQALYTISIPIVR